MAFLYSLHATQIYMANTIDAVLSNTVQPFVAQTVLTSSSLNKMFNGTILTMCNREEKHLQKHNLINVYTNKTDLFSTCD